MSNTYPSNVDVYPLIVPSTDSGGGNVNGPMTSLLHGLASYADDTGELLESISALLVGSDSSLSASGATDMVFNANQDQLNEFTFNGQILTLQVYSPGNAAYNIVTNYDTSNAGSTAVSISAAANNPSLQMSNLDASFSWSIYANTSSGQLSMTPSNDVFNGATPFLMNQYGDITLTGANRNGAGSLNLYDPSNNTQASATFTSNILNSGFTGDSADNGFAFNTTGNGNFAVNVANSGSFQVQSNGGSLTQDGSGTTVDGSLFAYAMGGSNPVVQFSNGNGSDTYAVGALWTDSGGAYFGINQADDVSGDLHLYPGIGGYIHAYENGATILAQQIQNAPSGGLVLALDETSSSDLVLDAQSADGDNTVVLNGNQTIKMNVPVGYTQDVEDISDPMSPDGGGSTSSVTINNGFITGDPTTCFIEYWRITPGGGMGHVYISAQSDGSVTLTSDSANETSTFGYSISYKV